MRDQAPKTLSIIVLTGTLAVGLAAGETKIRGVARTGIGRDGKPQGELANIMPNAKKAVGVSYKILQVEKGKESYVDEKKQTFKVGQQFKIALEMHNDMLLYIFHEGPDGKRIILMPDAFDKDVPKAKKDQLVVLPDDGSLFEFTNPAGKEKILVVASSVKLDHLNPKEAFEKLDAQKLTQLKTQQDQTIANVQKDVPVVKTTDPSEVAKNYSKSSSAGVKFRGMRWESDEADAENGRTILVGSTEQDATVVFEILMTSQP